ncbi:MAG: hypothetical protein ACOYS2_00920 [Patescibacteria group bacterium]
MYIEPLNKSENLLRREDREKDLEDFYSPKPEMEEMKNFEPARESLAEKYSQKALMHWKAPEFESLFRREKKWYMYIALILAVIIGYAVYTNSPLMAIVFVLIGILGYIYLNQDARELDFLITPDGIIAGREIYHFDNIDSFWIFYEPGDIKVISLDTKSFLTPFVHIPINDQDPVAIREILVKYIPEVKQEPSVIDLLERIIGI